MKINWTLRNIMNYKHLFGLLTFSPIIFILSMCFLGNSLLGLSSWFTTKPLKVEDITHERIVLHSSECRVKQLLQSMNDFSRISNFKACQRVFYNRVPKCASRTILSVIKVLSKRQDYNFITQVRSKDKCFLPLESERINFTVQFETIDDPFLFSKHIHYIDFSRYKALMPVYINVVRDPIQRVKSHYYYHIYGSHSAPHNVTTNINKTMTLDACLEHQNNPLDHNCTFNLNVALPFFCGHSKWCRSRHATAAMLARAKSVVREHYLVVGLTEDLPAFMEILEYYMPHFFQNATEVFKEYSSAMKSKYSTVKKFDLKLNTVNKLRRILALEYEFYDFVRQKMYNQLRKVRLYKQQEHLHLVLRNATFHNLNTTS